MYEEYSRQSLPSKKYRELLGSAICVFNANNAFIIENILRNDIENCYTWYNLIDKESGQLTDPIKKTITKFSNNDVANLFSNIIQKRNRIIHSFQITDNEGNQVLHTKERISNQQFTVTEDYLLDFIKENEELSQMLHNIRGF